MVYYSLLLLIKTLYWSFNHYNWNIILKIIFIKNIKYAEYSINIEQQTILIIIYKIIMVDRQPLHFFPP